MAVSDEEIPESLQRAMKDAGFVDPRTDRPSLNGWRRGSGVHTSTISRFVNGGAIKPESARKMADALGVSVDRMLDMAGQHKPAPWYPPQGTEVLTRRQRSALNELISAFIDQDKGIDDATQAEDEAGRGQGVPGAGDRTPMNLADVRRVKEDAAAFGDQPRRGEMDAPDYTTMAADDSPSRGRRMAEDDAGRGEEPQA